MHLLQELGITDKNEGVCTGAEGWLSQKKSKSFASINPSDGSVIAKVNAGNREHYETVIQKSLTAFTTWKMIPAPKRGEIVREIADKLRAKKKALGELVALEMGKSRQEGLGEVQEMIDIADFAVGLSRMLYGNSMHSERPQHRMYEQWHPYGVVAVITAFNFPVAVWAWNAFIAAVCGNTVIWKPSAKVPLCAVAVQHICNEVMKSHHLSGIFSLFITDDNRIANNLLEDARVPLVSFTGSTHVGRIVSATVGKRLGRTILELGGNNAIIVDPTADLKLVIPAVVFGAVGTAGQRCTTTRRLIIHESIYEDVIEKLINGYHQIKIGDPLDQQNHMGPLIDDHAVKQYQAAIKKIKKLNGEILFGGKALDRPGFFVEPCIARVDPNHDIVHTETFAPILYVMTYKNLEEALAINNGVRQGLSSAIFTRDLQTSETFLSSIGSDCGIANVNIGTSGAEIGGAFGGEKDTGGGREAGSDAWKAYMRRQTCTINWGSALPLAQGIDFKLA